MRRATRLRTLTGAVVLAACVSASVAGAQTDDTTPAPTTSSTTTTGPPTTSSSTTTTAAPTSPTSPASTVAPRPSPPDGPADTVYTPSTTEVAATRESFARLTDEQRSLLSRLQSARDELAKARVQLLGLAAKVDTARLRLAAADQAVAFAADVVQQARSRMRILRSEVAQLAASMYEHLGDGVLLDAINTADQTAVHRLRTYARAPQDALDEMVELSRSVERQLARARGQARVARAEAAAVLDAVQVLSEQRQDATLAAERASAEAERAFAAALGSSATLLAQVADPRFGADGITAALAAVQAGADAPATLIGRFRPPVAGAPLGSPYGIRVDPLTGSTGYHPGIDLEAGAGVEVHAAAGVVVVAGDCGGYGNCVVIDHGQAVATVSAHLSQVHVTPGRSVVDGEVVGLVGSTGRSTGPHLHFEVRLRGAPVDPLPTLAA